MKTLCELLDHPEIRDFFDNVHTQNSGYDSAYEQFITYSRFVAKSNEEFIKNLEEIGLISP